jgi:hypothetical protein
MSSTQSRSPDGSPDIDQPPSGGSNHPIVLVRVRTSPWTVEIGNQLPYAD